MDTFYSIGFLALALYLGSLTVFVIKSMIEDWDEVSPGTYLIPFVLAWLTSGCLILADHILPFTVQ